eukprot:2087750-Amphidinium_carterae.1
MGGAKLAPAAHRHGTRDGAELTAGGDTAPTPNSSPSKSEHFSGASALAHQVHPSHNTRLYEVREGAE